MQINITLFLQVINFLISYWFLNKFLFKLVFNFIHKKNLQSKRIASIIENKEHALLNLEEIKHQNLVNFRKDLQDNYTFTFKTDYSIPSDVKCKIEKDEIDRTLKKMKFLLLKKVPHVD